MDKGQALEAGKAFAEAHLKVIEAAYSPEIASEYAAGYVMAARNRFIDKVGPQETWGYFFGIAENLMEWNNQRERAGEV